VKIAEKGLEGGIRFRPGSQGVFVRGARGGGDSGFGRRLVLGIRERGKGGP